MSDFTLVASSLLGVLAGGGMASALLGWAAAQKRIVMENITQERAQWRGKIRGKALEVHDAMIDGDGKRIDRLRCEFRTLLNPHDVEDKKIIQALKNVQNFEQSVEMADDFAKRISWLLKHDWERAKLETTNSVFRSLSESIDTGSAGGKLIFHVFAALAEFERSLIRERTRAGLAAARARGRKGGRPRKLSLDQIRKAKAMLIDPDMTKGEVARHFHVTRMTLNKALTGT